MLTELEELGQTLKEHREQRRLTLKEVENATSIRMVYLQAIEEGKFSQIISPVYAQGFVRKYANFLDLDERQLFASFPHALHFLTTPSNEVVDLSDVGSVEVRGAPGKEKKRVAAAVWILGSSAFVLATWIVARSLGFV